MHVLQRATTYACATYVVPRVKVSNFQIEIILRISNLGNCLITNNTFVSHDNFIIKKITFVSIFIFFFFFFFNFKILQSEKSNGQQSPYTCIIKVM
jgi:hypothetical protein